MIFMDIKSSTFPLLSIDCVPKHVLARTNSVLAIAGRLVGFVAMRYAGDIDKVATEDRCILWLMAGVAMISSYTAIKTAWVWFWAKEPVTSLPSNPLECTALPALIS
jgi:hypothetical protein